MIAPEGYLPLQSALENIFDEIYPRVKTRFGEFEEHGKQQSHEISPYLYEDAVYFGTAVSLLQWPDEPVRIASPSGVVFRPTPELWQPLPGKVRLAVPLADSSLEDILKFVVPSITGYFAFVDHLSWTVRIPDVRGYRSKIKGVVDTIALAARLRPLDGYSLCVPDTLDLTTRFAIENDDVALRRGRPAIVPSVARLLNERYGNTRGNLTWKQLALEVSDTLGRSVGVQSIKRAMRQNDRSGLDKN